MISNIKVKNPKWDLLWINDEDLVFFIKNQAKKEGKRKFSS